MDAQFSLFLRSHACTREDRAFLGSDKCVDEAVHDFNSGQTNTYNFT